MAKFGVVSVYDPIHKFEGWSGGKDTLNDLIDAFDGDREAVFDKLYYYLADIGLLDDEENIDEGELNDTLWFDRDNIYEYFGLDEYGNPKEDDEDEGDEDDEDEETEDSADRRLRRKHDSARRKPVVQVRRDFKKRGL